ncbi:Hypothetical predicted protein [Paramuricea clavata]|uniref:Uncharacterized protein n=1 Tax=Paramuricea clavata TaxID=317549 RepID=A0A6S7H8D2_PARCT|nr:Hypothetical predicted protein [Paramuricea clavata]
MQERDAHKLQSLGCNQRSKLSIMSNIYGTQNDVLLQSGLADALDEEDLTSSWKVSRPCGNREHQDFMSGSERIGQKSLKLLLSCLQDKALELKEDSTRMIAHSPIEIYRNMLDAFEEFRHFRFDLRALKDICPERDGENIYPACPKENGVLYESFDALFGLPRKKSSGIGVLEPVRSGLLFADQQVVDNFVNNYQDKGSDSDCNNFLAGNALRSNQRFAGLDETGIFGRACRHEFPKAFVNLKHGERISYAVWLINDMVSKAKEKNMSYSVLYISCILHHHLQIMYSLRQVEGCGLTDGEVIEHLWSYLRGFASITKEMSPSRRIDALTDCLLHYGRQSKSKLREVKTTDGASNGTA